METVSKEALLRNRIPQDYVEVDGVGLVLVRGMSRHEMIESSKVRASKGDEQAERYIVSTCMLGPKLEQHEVAEWQKASLAPEINTIAHKINELSGTAQGAAKSDVPGDADGS